MWKILVLTLVIAAFADAKFELKGRPRQRLRMSLEEECKKYSELGKADKTYNSVLTAISCLYTDKEVTEAFHKLNHINSTETFVIGAEALCNARSKIVPCYRVMLEAFEPCAPPAVREQIDSMQQSIETLAEFICLDDCAKLRKFAADGAFDCMEAQETAINRCTANITDLTTELPEDTTTFLAIDACHRYDAMVSCINEVLKSCPKESTLSFLNRIFTQFRQGTYCHVTLPLEKEADLTNDDNTERNAEDNKL